MKKLKLLLLLLTVTVFLAEAKKPPALHFSHLPLVSNPVLSPNGEITAAIHNTEEGPAVVVGPFGSQQLATILRLKKSRDRVDWIEWASDERILVAASFAERYLGDWIRVSRLFSIKKDGSGLKEIARRRHKDEPEWTKLFSTSRVISYLPNEPNAVVLELYDPRDEAKSAFKVNIITNKFEKLLVNRYKVDSWYANDKGDVVFGVDIDEEFINIWYRPDNQAQWKQLHSRKRFESETFSPVLLKGNKAYVISDHEIGRQALWLYDIPTDKFEKLVFSAPNNNVESVILNAERDEVIGVRYFEHYRKDHYFSEANAKQYTLIKNSFPNTEVTVVSRDKSKQRLLISTERDNRSTAYAWLDLAAKTGGMWFSEYPYLNAAKLVSVTPFEFQTKDEMTLNGYFTLPNTTTDKKVPLIVLPHGGPQARDYQYFDPYVQFFASRGYAVLQVNFRGSEGFNNYYETSGYQQWGKKMQSDVYEAVDWIKAQNIIDEKNMCVVGASYGGFVALTAAIQQPENFNCFISIAGVADLEALVAKEYKYPYKRAFLNNTIGHYENSDTINEFNQVSAMQNIDKIKRPILLMHGEKDTRVHVSQSQDFYNAAKKQGINVQYIELEDGTHFLDEWNNRVKAFNAMDEFLSKHLPVN